MTAYENWQPVIGLEIHVQLNTRTKLFSSAPNHFGDEPNTNIGIVDTGQPGALPVLNKEAVKKAVMFGCAIGAKIPLFSKFDRKSYFYPDSPRNFQITQFEEPILIGGKVTTELDDKMITFEVEHAHLEDDAGMLKHFSGFAGVDYNRAGVPLIEIVSTPCMHSPREAAAYAKAVRAIVQYLDVSDCNMQEGSIRFDANISVRPKGSTELRTKTEIKNMNSFHNMELAVEAEIRRQIYEYENGNEIKQATYRFDLEKKQTIMMRSKEVAADYRYFPEPDLPPILLTQPFIDDIRKNLPELPYDRFRRYIETFALTPYSAAILVNEKILSDYFEKALKICQNPRAISNWITVEFLGRLKDTGKQLWDIGMPAEHVGYLVEMIENKTITGKIAKSVADIMVENPTKDPRIIVEENPDFKPMSDVSSIEPLVDQVLAENPQSIIDFKAGKDKAFNYLVGQVMKLCKGKATPDIVKELIQNKIQ